MIGEMTNPAPDPNQNSSQRNLRIAQTWHRLSPNARGMLLMAVFACLVALLHVIVRRLSQELHPMEIAFFRTIIPLVILVPMLMRQGEGWWRTTRPGLQFIRGILGGAQWHTADSLHPQPQAGTKGRVRAQ